MSGTLYLIPTPLGIHSEIPETVKQLVIRLRHFIAESEKESRRFLSKCGYDLKQHYPEFYILNEHTKSSDLKDFIKPLIDGKDMGLMSDAGLPAVADPGNNIVALCHKNGIKVIPMLGPSSIMYALMCSGFNGQQFRFHGYIPARNPERTQSLKKMDLEHIQTGITQIFIETPYRNKAVFDDILKVVKKETGLCVVQGIDTDDFKVLSKPVSQWKVEEMGETKVPAVFLLGSMA